MMRRTVTNDVFRRLPVRAVRFQRYYIDSSKPAQRSFAIHAVKWHDRPDRGPKHYPRAQRVPRPANRPGSQTGTSPNRWSDIPNDASPQKTLSADAVEIQRQLATGRDHPASLLRTAISERRAPLDVVRVCLQAYRRQIESLNKEKWAEEVKQFPILAVTLQHVWEKDALWIELLLKDYETSGLLIWFAVAEKMESVIFDWLKVEMPEKSLDELALEGRQHFIWRNTIFRNLIQGLLDHDAGGPADRALKFFFYYLDTRSNALSRDRAERTLDDSQRLIPGHPAWLTTSPSPAAIALSRALGSGQHPGTDARLFDRLIMFLERYSLKQSDDQRELAIARLKLLHPRSPDPSPAIQLFRRIFEQRSATQAMEYLPKYHGARYVFLNTFRDASRVSKALGRQHDARWLDAKRLEIFGPPPKQPRARPTSGSG